MPLLSFSQRAAFDLALKNDVLKIRNGTDQYFTNGVEINILHQGLANHPVNAILIGNRSNAITGFKVEQNLYTPTNLSTPEIIVGDRPYASFLLFSQQMRSTHQKYNYAIQSSFGVGVLGKYSGGGKTQNFVHEVSPTSGSVHGWHNEIASDFLLDYKLQIEKGLLNSDYLRVNTIGQVQLGTLQTQAATGLAVHVGLLHDYFKSPLQITGNRFFTIDVFSQIMWHYRLYDATLNGGMLNKNSLYTIAPNGMERGMMTQQLGIQLSLKKYVFTIGQMRQTPEFKGATSHVWGYMRLQFLF